ncbi:hypothetical protein [Tenacibaculum xiamenense]|uniref:hypothetical protein n=1 Tax=Tenacibaculum xiamenense TaxID=1261553 RepID=UPI0038941D9C
MKKCKQCNTSEFKIYPNRLCQKCLSYNKELFLLEKGVKPTISSDELITEYIIKEKSINQIAKDKNLKPFQIRKLLTDFLIPVKSQSESKEKKIDEKIFKKLTARSAFLLGYIYTDGDLVLNKTTKKYFLRVYSKHKTQIEKIKKILKSDAKIQYRKEKSYNNFIQGGVYFIHVGNQIIINDLLDFGLTLTKNENVTFPKIPKNLINHFIRGCWAGSGNVTTYNGRVFSSLTIGSIKFMTEIEKTLNLNGLKIRNIYKNSHSKKPSYKIKYAHSESEKLYNYLYKGKSTLTTSDKQQIIYTKYFKRK